MEHTGYPLYFPPSEMSFYWRRWPERCKRRLRSLSIPFYPFLSLSFSLSLSLCLCLLAANDFKVVAGNRFANPWRRRIGPFRTPAPRFHFVHYPTTRLCLSFWLSLSIMGFRRSLANCRNPVYRVNPFVLRYYGLTIMQRISRHCVYAVRYRSFLYSEQHYASIDRRSIIAT